MKRFVCFCLLIIFCCTVSVFAQKSQMYMTTSPIDGGYRVSVVMEGVTCAACSFEISYNSENYTLANMTYGNVLEESYVMLNDKTSKNSAKVSFISQKNLDISSEIVSFDMTAKLPGVVTDVEISNIIIVDYDENPIELSCQKITIGKKSSTSSSPSSSSSSQFSSSASSSESASHSVNSDFKIDETSVSDSVNDDKSVTEPKFKDTASCEWAVQQIEFLAQKGIINGTSSGMFSPEEKIKRADFICMLMRMMNVETVPCEDFDDVFVGEYWYESVMTARGAGIAQGYNNCFNPSDFVTRQDIFVLLCRAYGIAGTFSPAQFSDYHFISDYAKSSVDALTQLGIVRGNNGNINPLDNATRAETAVMLYNIYNYYGGN